MRIQQPQRSFVKTVSLFALLLLLCAPTAQISEANEAARSKIRAGKKYQIKFSYPSKVNDKYNLEVHSVSKTKFQMTQGKAVLQNKTETADITLNAVVTILKVDAKGNALKKSVQIKKFIDSAKKPLGPGVANAENNHSKIAYCAIQNIAKPTVLLKPNTVVIAETVKGKTEYRLVKGTLSPEAKKHLAEIIKTHTKESMDDETILGIKTPQAVGAQWKINSAAAAKSMKVDAKTITGTVQLLKAVENKKGGYLLLKTQIKIKAFPGNKAPQGFRVEKPSMIIKATGALPIDVTQKASISSMPPENFSMQMALAFVGNVPQTQGMKITISTEVKQTKKETPVK